MSKFEVETYTIVDGWKNIWYDDVGIPESFNSFEEAVTYLDEHLDECAEDGLEVNRDDYRVTKLDLMENL
jgi:hypothetical protein|tara:strand:+ start:47 stop:256 length:210 start_codon:yes stop_codon:yes gene_type:complete